MRYCTSTKEPEEVSKEKIETCSGKTVQTTKSKVLILNNSHLKGSVPRRGNYLSSKFEVGEFIKPGAGFKIIVGKTIMDSFRLTKNDVLVLHSGVNDVCNSHSRKVILQIVKFLQDNDNANIIMLDIPHRHDLSDISYVNKEIKTFNSKLKKTAKLFNHVTILVFNSNRNLFTQHGLHLNGFGKGLLAEQIASLLYKLNGENH